MMAPEGQSLLLAVAVFLALPSAAFPQAVEPELFGAGSVSSGLDELNAAFSPDGRELYYSINAPENSLGVIVVSRLVGGSWTSPEVASFSGQYSDYDPFISPDGTQLFFISNRPVGSEEKSPTDFDIWVVDRSGDDWGEPRNLGAPVNTDRPEYYVSATEDGTLYFSARRDGSHGSYDIYRSRNVAGRYQEPENLGEGINGRNAEIDVFVAPDESFVVFAGYGRADSHGGGDLYLSYHRGGAWTPAVNLGPGINSRAREYTPMGSPDGRWLYWTSKRGFADSGHLPDRVDITGLRLMLTGYGNGEGDIYRIPMSEVHARAQQALAAADQ